ncbi:hypothetical protein OAK75_02745 [Bacteriovoracales bacterium]|nr:hypothetical protein [Bacteriovoracales bacterium]
MKTLIVMIFLSMSSAYSMDSFKISAVRKSKPFSCSSAIGDARRKVLDICKKAGKVLNYDTYDIPILCDWEELPKKGKEPQFKATIKVGYECIDKE